MRLLKSALVVAALALASPVWAGGGHGHGDKHHKRDRDHHGWDDRRDHSEWRHHRHHGRHVDRRVIYSQQYYYRPYPVYQPYPVYAAPAPGVHIVVPNIYIPIR